ncbi:AAA family ATPase [Dactylosporangium roseum]|uniref:AAA family ATPase n=1 Tax=Dactylosporangium roseum TaxID=47989 RepID=A0ABY5Z2D8_9ACTN|nr:ATP-binding protein [Dactylosporangium roseum]UWZ36188.1 AAA family ATPase [Dactylosporangium roseum]
MNPYANYGLIVTGAEFVGRQDEMRSVRSRTFSSLAPVSIVGAPRIGKSSLAQQALDSFAMGESPAGLVFVPVWITVSGADSEQSLFRELADLIQEWLDDRGKPTDRLHVAYAALNAAVTWDDMCRCLKAYLRQVRRSGYQVVAVLDEFDAARNVFTRAAPFEFLRTLAHEEKFRVGLIITSRRSLGEIVVKSTAEMSTFPGIFGQSVTLGCFTAPELAALIGRSPYPDGELRDALAAWLTMETGGHPFLSSALLSVLHERWEFYGLSADGALDQDCRDAVATCGQLVVDYYKSMLELLREENRLGKLLEVLFGPQETAGPLDAERMAREGIIKPTNDGWAAFSESFGQYLLLLEDTRTSDDWQLWHRTETGLRAALTSALESAYGESWRVTLADSQSRLVRECQKRQERDRAFGEVTDEDSLLDYTHPRELLQVMMLHWQQVEPFFGHDKQDWHQRLELIAKVRNPMAHNRNAGTSPALMEHFRAACRDILDWLPASAAGQPA